jgi:hypothetical protein
MIIRNLKQKKILNKKTIFWVIVFFVGIYFVSKLFIWIVERFNQTAPQNAPYTLGASLTFAGKIIVDNDFPNYTHSLVNKEWRTIGLKSSTINLNAYIDEKIELVGRVKKYLTTVPILAVDTIKIPDQWLIITANRYFFVKELMYLDFSTQPQLSAVKSWNNIQVIFNENPAVSIERFVCSKILKSRDCAYLITDYITNKKDEFTSYRWYTFYKHGTGFWTTFDDNIFGFLFKDVSDDTILDISNMFKIVNKDFIVENKLDLIKSNCQNEFVQLNSIDPEGILTYSDPYSITLDLKWLDKKKGPVTCKITFDMWNDRNVTDIQFN